MRQVSMREFRTRGSKALKKVPSSETVVLAGRKGPEFFLIPVMGDIASQNRDLEQAMAKASLRMDWKLAREYGLDQITDEEIDAEIDAVRREVERRQKK